MNRLLGNGVGLLAALLIGMPAQAASRWIKATFTGTITDAAYNPSNTVLYLNDGTTPITSFTWNFVIQDYTGTNNSSAATWQQAISEYFPIFGYGTLTDSTGMNGINWYKYSAPDNFQNSVIFTKSSGVSSGFQLRASAAGSPSNYSGYTIYGSPDYSGNNVGEYELISVEFTGGPLAVVGSSPAQLLNVANTDDTNVTSFIQGAVAATNNFTTFQCTAGCQGNAQTPEFQFYYTWDTVSFSEVVPTPSPLPVLGAGSCFVWARSLRMRRSHSKDLNGSKKFPTAID